MVVVVVVVLLIGRDCGGGGQTGPPTLACLPRKSEKWSFGSGLQPEIEASFNRLDFEIPRVGQKT